MSTTKYMNVISNLFKGEAKSKWGIGANIFTHERQRKIIQELLKTANRDGLIKKVLDCPSGYGRMVDLLFSWHVTCADLSKVRNETVKMYFPDNEIRMVECDIFDLPFDNNEFDLVLNCLLIQHIEKSRLSPLLKELRRVTSQWLIVTYPSFYALANLNRFLKKINKTMLTKKEFSDVVSDAGFRIVKSRNVLPFITNCKIVLLEKIE